jgi:DNA polymerase elongation subunit (family B)
MAWADISYGEKMTLLDRRYNQGESVATLAAELDMNPVTLNRRLQELRSDVIEDTEETKKGSRSRSAVYPRVDLTAAVFDIETMDFGTGGVQSHLVCCSILPLESKKPYTLSIRFGENRSDRRLLKDIIEALSKYDILIGHNITAYDLNWLFSRWMYYGFGDVLPSWLMYDTYQVAKSMALRVESKSLGALGAYFGVQGTKTRIFRTDWSLVDSPDETEFDDALKAIVYHCEQDVLLNRGVFYALWNYDPKRVLRKTKW